MSLEYEELTGKIIGAAIDVHRELGPGFIESFYENALVVRLTEIGLRSRQQESISVLFHGVEVGKHRIDLLVESIVLVDLKAIKDLENVHFAVLRSQLRATGCRHGLLLNFSKPTWKSKESSSMPSNHPKSTRSKTSPNSISIC
jgi:GxxExxY protein